MCPEIKLFKLPPYLPGDNELMHLGHYKIADILQIFEL